MDEFEHVDAVGTAGGILIAWNSALFVAWKFQLKIFL
jgi:hypothetical protein